MILHYAPGSAHSAAVRIVAAERGIVLEERAIDLTSGGQFASAFLAIDGRGQVPVIENDRTMMGETFPLLLYFDAIGDGASLAGDTPPARYHVHKWGKYVETHIAPHLAIVRWHYKGETKAGPSETALARLPRPRAELWRRALSGFTVDQVRASQNALDIAIQRVAADLETRDWLAQESFTLADAAVYPHLAQFGELGVTIPAAVAAWLDRVAARTSVRALAADIFAVPTMGPEPGRWG